MMANDKTERIKSIIGWMRKNITLSLDNHRLGRGKTSKIRRVGPDKGGRWVVIG
jgi:hypothetical protein